VLAAASLAACAVTALVLVLALPGGGAPTVAEVAELGMRPALDPAPRSRPGEPAFVQASFAGISFPNWSGRFGWHTSGARSDRLDGRETRTVFYSHMGHRIGYTIVSGSPLDPPPGAERIRRNGVEIALVQGAGREFAVLERNGRTCVLSGHFADNSTLVKLAAWTGDGEIRF
jgi:hypothetical protein